MRWGTVAVISTVAPLGNTWHCFNLLGNKTDVEQDTEPLSAVCTCTTGKVWSTTASSSALNRKDASSLSVSRVLNP
jgi:hypothetical protein